MHTPVALSPERQRWVSSVAGAPVTGARRELTGGSRELWYVALGGDAPTREVVLRIDTGAGAFTDSPYTLAREATVYRALAGGPVPVPALLGTSDDALLMERAPGSSRLGSLHDEEAASMVASLMAAVGSLHQVDPTTLELPGFERPADRGAAVREELAIWRGLAGRSTRPADPLVAYALAWLAARCPAGEARPVLVQGDTGPGNFVGDKGRVTALVDWELSHLGDPMDDIAWIDHRCQSLTGPFGDVARRDDCYEAATGARIDAELVAYFAVLVRLRCLVTTELTLDRGAGALGLAVYGPPHHRFREELALALLAAEHVDSSAGAVANEPLDEAHTFLATLDDHAIRGLRDVVLPACTSREATLHARAALLTLEHHAMVERFGPAIARAEAADRRTTLGHEPDDEALALLAAQAGASGDADVLHLLHRGARRSRLLWNTPAAPPTTALAPTERGTS